MLIVIQKTYDKRKTKGGHGMSKTEVIDLLEATRQRIAEQGRIVDSRLLSKEKMLEQLLINWENET